MADIADNVLATLGAVQALTDAVTNLNTAVANLTTLVQGITAPNLQPVVDAVNAGTTQVLAAITETDALLVPTPAPAPSPAPGA